MLQDSSATHGQSPFSKWFLHIRDPVSAEKQVNIAQDFFRLDELQSLAAAMSAWLKNASLEGVQASAVSASCCTITSHSDKCVSSVTVADMLSGIETR